MLELVGTKRKKAIQEKITIQLEKINQKVLTKEGRLKEMTRKHINNRMQEKPKILE